MEIKSMDHNGYRRLLEYEKMDSGFILLLTFLILKEINLKVLCYNIM